MTVSTTSNRKNYTGDGVSTVFAFPYKFITTSDIYVYLAGVLQVSGYTVGAPSDTGANITFSIAPVSLAAVTILSDPARIQSTSLPSTGPFPAKTVETMADKLTLLVQRLYDLVSRSFVLADGDSSTASTILPTPSANQLIGWNATATGLQNIDSASLATIVAYGTSNADKFNGNGVTTAFSLSANPGALNNLDVAIGGVTQRPGIDFTWTSGTTITFSTPPVVGVNNVLARYMLGLPQGTADAGAVTYSDAASYGGGTVGDRLKTILSSAGAALVGFLPLGTGAVATTVQSKLRETVSVFDFLTTAQIADVRSGSPALDLSTPLAAAATYLAANSTRFKLVFPSGIYSYSVSPNWAIGGAQIEAQGEVRLRYTGTGNAVIIDAGAGAQVCYNFKMGDFIVEAPNTALNGVFVRSIHHSQLSFTVRGCGTASAGMLVNFAVCTSFNYRCSVNENGWYLAAKPAIGLSLAIRGAGETVSYCLFNNCVVEAPTIGIQLTGTLGNVFVGGTSEGCSNYGVFANAGANNDLFLGMDFESNTTADVYVLGKALEFRKCDSTNTFTFGSTSQYCVLDGGNHGTVLFDTGGTYNTGVNFRYNRLNNGATFTDASTSTFLSGVRSGATGALYLTGTNSWTPGLIGGSGGSTSRNITVTGAKMGDVVVASFTTITSGLLISAGVTAADTVTAWLVNETGAGITPSAGTVKAAVLRT